MRLMTKQVLVSVLLAGAVATLNAGGWAVISVQNVPTHVRPGERLTIDYAVRQHGVSLLGGLQGHLDARCGSRSLQAKAMPLEAPGYYRATLTVPGAETCTLTIDSGFNNVQSVPITVPVLPAGEPPPTLSPVAVGRQLFAAKGCLTCHAHPSVEGRSVAVGPDLTATRPSAARISLVLSRRDRPAPKTEEDSGMPDLGLSNDEIAALRAFLLEGPPAPAPARQSAVPGGNR